MGTGVPRSARPRTTIFGFLFESLREQPALLQRGVADAAARSDAHAGELVQFGGQGHRRRIDLTKERAFSLPPCEM